MQHDDVIWQVINNTHCTYKVKTKTQNFCRNEFNVSGLCNRSSCPLANSRYATIKEEKGRIYLYLKTIERAHTPTKLWQKIRLRKQYAQALEQIDEHLEYFPKFLIHKNKQRLTKITQYLIKMRRLATRVRPKLVPIATRTEKRERKREAKAETAARLETSIEAELLGRLKAGTYGDIYNIPHAQYEKVLAQQETIPEAETEFEEAEEFVEGDEESEDEEEAEEEIEYVNDEDVDLDEEDEDDMEDYEGSGDGQASLSGSDGEDEPHLAHQIPVRRKRGTGDSSQPGKRLRKHLELEYEEEREPLQQQEARTDW